MTCFHSILTVTLRVALASKATFSSIHGEEASCASSDGHCCRHGKLSCTHFEPCEVPAAPEVFMVQYFATKSTTSGSMQETDGEELRNDRKKSNRSKLVDATIEACDWQCYLSRYPDLQTALGATNTAGAEAHYLAQGQPEGRDCTCSDAAIEACDWQCYLRRYPDLQTALGATNTAGAEAHYLANGQSEGRGCTCSDEVDTEETGETASATVASPPDDVESPSTMQATTKILWFSAVSVDPACPVTIPSEYLRFYKVAVASSRAVGNDAFVPHLVVHIPEDVAWSSVNATLRAELDGLKSNGVVVIIHTLSITQRLKQLDMYDECNAGAYLRIDLPQIVAKIGMVPGVDRKFVFYTDMDIMWREAISLSEWKQMVPTNDEHIFKYSVEQDKSSQRPMNTGVMILNVEGFELIHDEFIKFGIDNSFKFKAFDQGWINDFSAAFGKNELLTNTLNWKVYWGNSGGIKIVHLHGPKPGRGLDCFARYINEWRDNCEMIRIYRTLLGEAEAADGGDLARSVMREFDNYDRPIHESLHKTNHTANTFDWLRYASKRHPEGVVP